MFLRFFFELDHVLFYCPPTKIPSERKRLKNSFPILGFTCAPHLIILGPTKEIVTKHSKKRKVVEYFLFQ